MRVLVLGGTTQGRALAEALADGPGLEVVSSLAGRVARPRLPAGQVRVGGFGATGGLAAFLVEQRIDRVVDATHPFAARITAQAVAACTRTGVPLLLLLRRPGWTQSDGDRWLRVPDTATAAATVAALPPGVVLLTIGRHDLEAFSPDTRHRYAIRSVDPPSPGAPLPPRHTVLLARGPFTLDDERTLLRDLAVTALVTRDSGGHATAPKLQAARDLGLPVVMIDRPPAPVGPPVTTTVADAAAWASSTACAPDRR